MKLIYTNPNQILVENAKNLLENSGLTTVIKNQFLSSGFGELSGIDTWPELWLLDESEYETALELIKGITTVEAKEDYWVCINCGEFNDPAFEACWNCQQEKL